MPRQTERAVAQIGRGVSQVEDAIESLTSTLGDALGDRLPALAERLADRFPDVAERVAERLGDRVPALQRYTHRRPSAGDNALSFTEGLLFGALIGAVAAYLFAPSDGSTMRERLQRRLDELMGYSPPPPASPEAAAEVPAIVPAAAPAAAPPPPVTAFPAGATVEPA